MIRRLCRVSVLPCVCASILSCTDPRARPVPPVLDVQFAPDFKVTSPGTILGSIYMFDDDGMNTVRIRVKSDDLEINGDSLIAFAGEQEITRTLHWTVPPNLLSGGGVNVIISAEDLAGFVTRDSLRFIVQ